MDAFNALGMAGGSGGGFSAGADGMYVNEASCAVLDVDRCLAVAARVGVGDELMGHAAGQALLHHLLRRPQELGVAVLRMTFDVVTRDVCTAQLIPFLVKAASQSAALQASSGDAPPQDGGATETGENPALLGLLTPFFAAVGHPSVNEVPGAKELLPSPFTPQRAHDVAAGAGAPTLTGAAALRAVQVPEEEDSRNKQFAGALALRACAIVEAGVVWPLLLSCVRCLVDIAGGQGTTTKTKAAKRGRKAEVVKRPTKLGLAAAETVLDIVHRMAGVTDVEKVRGAVDEDALWRLSTPLDALVALVAAWHDGYRPLIAEACRALRSRLDALCGLRHTLRAAAHNASRLGCDSGEPANAQMRQVTHTYIATLDLVRQALEPPSRPLHVLASVAAASVAELDRVVLLALAYGSVPAADHAAALEGFADAAGGVKAMCEVLLRFLANRQDVAVPGDTALGCKLSTAVLQRVVAADGGSTICGVEHVIQLLRCGGDAARAGASLAEACGKRHGRTLVVELLREGGTAAMEAAAGILHAHAAVAGDEGVMRRVLEAGDAATPLLKYLPLHVALPELLRQAVRGSAAAWTALEHTAAERHATAEFPTLLLKLLLQHQRAVGSAYAPAGDACSGAQATPDPLARQVPLTPADIGAASAPADAPCRAVDAAFAKPLVEKWARSICEWTVDAVDPMWQQLFAEPAEELVVGAVSAFAGVAAGPCAPGVLLSAILTRMREVREGHATRTADTTANQQSVVFACLAPLLALRPMPAQCRVFADSGLLHELSLYAAGLTWCPLAARRVAMELLARGRPLGPWIQRVVTSSIPGTAGDETKLRLLFICSAAAGLLGEAKSTGAARAAISRDAVDLWGAALAMHNHVAAWGGGGEAQRMQRLAVVDALSLCLALAAAVDMGLPEGCGDMAGSLFAVNIPNDTGAASAARTGGVPHPCDLDVWAGAIGYLRKGGCRVPGWFAHAVLDATAGRVGAGGGVTAPEVLFNLVYAMDTEACTPYLTALCEYALSGLRPERASPIHQGWCLKLLAALMAKGGNDAVITHLPPTTMAFVLERLADIAGRPGDMGRPTAELAGQLLHMFLPQG